jgi:hypothetical protein
MKLELPKLCPVKAQELELETPSESSYLFKLKNNLFI